MNRAYILLLSLLIASLAGCRNVDYIDEYTYENDDEEYDESLVDLTTYPSWSRETHSNAVDPNFEQLFVEGEVLRLDITISTSSWSSMLSDLSSNYRYINSSGSDYTPIWVPCTVSYDGKDWYEVGIRFKGNSSLQQTYSSGNYKRSLKLDFDQYEDDYPALTNQRFYGFKQLNLNNNYDDESMMREKVGADLFRAFGLAAAHTQFCALYVDTGSGSQYYGVYTIVEEVDDTVIDTQFSSGSGNLYKPDGDAASFKSGTYDTSEFYLKTNTSSANYSDVKSLYDALHSSDRSSSSATWQSRLEGVFDVDSFLRWMAANAVIQNWDTYGNMTHNYFLYCNPSNGLLTWIPWDNNEAFQSGTGEKSPIEMSKMGSVSSSWPLISYLYDISEYQERYEGYLKQFVDEVFVTAELQSLYSDYYDLLKEYAYAERSGCTFLESSSDFDSAVTTLKSHVESRTTYVYNYVK